MKMITLTIGEELYQDIKRRGMQHRNIYVAGYKCLLGHKNTKEEQQEGIISSVEKKVFKLSSLLSQYVEENERIKAELLRIHAEKGV